MDWQISCHDLRKGRDMALLEINYYSKMLAKSNEFHVTHIKQFNKKIV